MKTLTQPAATVPILPDQAARAGWRRRVARIGSLIQLAFAALWLARSTLATGWPGRLPIALSPGRLPRPRQRIARQPSTWPLRPAPWGPGR